MSLKTLQEEILTSSEFRSHAEKTLEDIKGNIYNHYTESEVASEFENRIFALIKNRLGISIHFLKEVTKNDLGFPFDGRIDMTQNSLLVEYKRPTQLNTDTLQKKAMDQLEKYLLQVDSNLSIETAIVTDGKRIGKLILKDNKVQRMPFREMRTGDFLEIITSLVYSDSKKLNSRNIVEDFGIQGNNTVTPQLANLLFNKLLKNNNVQTKLVYKEWLELFHLSENDSGKNQDITKRRNQLSRIFEVEINDNTRDYKALFALQTAYAIILKLIAAKTIGILVFEDNKYYFSDLTNTTASQLHTFLKRMEDGDSYNAQGVRNLLEGDFFSWYSFDEQWDEELAVVIKQVIEKVEQYSAAVMLSKNQVPTDVFKDLYIEIMPQAARHSLGEYYTPGWLADEVLNNSIKQIYDKEIWKAVDPTCGSGIFLSTMISKIIEDKDTTNMENEEKIILRNEILNRVKGVDINPLNVLTARVSYLLALSPLLTNENDFEIPVFLGDSAVTPDVIIVDNEDCIAYDIALSDFKINAIFPQKFVKSIDFGKNLNMLKKVLRLKNEKVFKKELFKYFKQLDLNVSADLEKRLDTMILQLVDLERKNWNGLWLQVIGNYIKTATISDMDIVIGNPPWVKWEFLPQKYAEKIKTISIERHLFSGQTYMGAISLNICALIAHVTATTWLSKDGVLAFLMPKTIMTQDSYEGFRNFIVNDKERFYLQYAEDWEKSGHPFIDMKDSFLSYFFKRDFVNYQEGVPLTYVIKKRGKNALKMTEINQKHNYKEVEDQFEKKEGFLVKVDETRSGFTFVQDSSQMKNFSRIVGKCMYKARSGVEFTPKEVYMLKFIDKSQEDGNAIFENLKSKGTTHKVNQTGPLKLETRYIRPLITGPTISKFTIQDRNQFCIYPYDDGEISSVSIDNLLDSCPNLSSYLINQKDIIGGQSERSKALAKGDGFYSLSKIGKYTYSKYRVVFRDNSKWAAAVSQEIKTPWNETILPIPAKHAPYISKNKNGEDISEEEAYYLCAILNSPVVESYMLSTFSSRSISIDLKIKIPLFDHENKLHLQLCECAKAIANKKMDLDSGLKKINELYLELCDI
ncbi:hypothetical protein AALA44_05455 [Enterococcus ratti]|uniref:Eco57I restriction-modification methylase domain-containing protein n=1 Tax=Enterococcus ratti TaxID=150033 RepID=UPI003516FEDD